MNRSWLHCADSESFDDVVPHHLSHSFPYPAFVAEPEPRNVLPNYCVPPAAESSAAGVTGPFKPLSLHLVGRVDASCKDGL